MRQRSRNYARRQLTWMRKTPNLRPIDMTERTASAAADEIAGVLAGDGRP
jgi:tRNA A37 N6-isopentenylltransferase MiaA